jgi:hypothetical protein
VSAAGHSELFRTPKQQVQRTSGLPDPVGECPPASSLQLQGLHSTGRRSATRQRGSVANPQLYTLHIGDAAAADLCGESQTGRFGGSKNGEAAASFGEPIPLCTRTRRQASSEGLVGCPALTDT